MNTERVYNVLFVTTKNAARGILGESILRGHSFGRFNAYSAGTEPAEFVDSRALVLLRRVQMPVDGLRSKSISEFLATDAPRIDFVFTLSLPRHLPTDLPALPGSPVISHWGLPDPAAATGSELEQLNAFRETFRALERRILLFAALPIASLDDLTLKVKLGEIGATV
jgi:arsenate reductase